MDHLLYPLADEPLPEYLKDFEQKSISTTLKTTSLQPCTTNQASLSSKPVSAMVMHTPAANTAPSPPPVISEQQQQQQTQHEFEPSRSLSLKRERSPDTFRPGKRIMKLHENVDGDQDKNAMDIDIDDGFRVTTPLECGSQAIQLETPMAQLQDPLASSGLTTEAEPDAPETTCISIPATLTAPIPTSGIASSSSSQQQHTVSHATSLETLGSPHLTLPSPSASPQNRDFEDDKSESPSMDVEDPVFGTMPLMSWFRPGSRKTVQMFDSFENLSPRFKSYVLYNLLKRTDRKTLALMSGLIVPALRRDLLSSLPAELGYHILSYLDVKSLCSAARVAKSWATLIDSSDWLWKNLLAQDDFTVTDEVLNQAIDEKWGYTGWSTSSAAGLRESLSSAFKSTNKPNVYKAIYRRKYLTFQNWMNPNSKPKRLSVQGHGSDVVTCLQFDDDKIVTGSDDNTISIYDTATGALRHRFSGHDGGVWALKYSGNTLVTGSTDRTVRVWDIAKKRCTHVFQGHSSTVRCLDILEPSPVTEKDGSITVMPKEPIIVTGSRDMTLRVWKLPPSKTKSVNYTEAENPYFVRTMVGHTNSVRALSGYGDTVVSGSYDTTVRVWKISTGECQWELRGHGQRVYSAVLDHKRNRCISGSMDWFVKVWCIETGTLLYTLEGHTSLVGLIDLDRSTIVSAAADSTLRVWDPETGHSLHKLVGHQGPITCFQHDENKVVAGSEKYLKLWDIRTGEHVRDLLTGLSRIWQVNFNDRRCVAAVQREDKTFIEIMDFYYDPQDPSLSLTSSSNQEGTNTNNEITTIVQRQE